jgi:hypothetical protein
MVQASFPCLPKKLVTHAKQLTACSHNTPYILKALHPTFSSTYFYKEINVNFGTLCFASHFPSDANDMSALSNCDLLTRSQGIRFELFPCSNSTLRNMYTY